MSEEATQDNLDINKLGDEEFLNLEESAFIVEGEAPAEEEEKPAEEVVDEATEEDPEPSEEEGEEEAEEEAESTEESTEETTDELNSDKKVIDDKGEDGTGDSTPESDEKDAKDSTDDAAKAEAFFKEVTAPFKANGVMHEIDSPEDVVRLMKMGLNYSKKMTVLKPHLNMIKMLDRQGLLDEGKLSYLIDLDKKDPKAISKLVKESGIDQYELAKDDTDEYSPKSYALSDEEVQLEDVIADVKESEGGTRTLNIIGKEWDDESKRIIANKPAYIGLINEQVINGQYDQITALVTKERALGKLVGLSDIQAYDAVGKQLLEAGTLVGMEAPPEKKIVKRKVDKPKSDNSSRKKAASIGSKRPIKKSKETNPLDIKSDEAFLKEFDKLVL